MFFDIRLNIPFMKKSNIAFLIFLSSLPFFVQAQSITKDYKVVTSAVPFLTISPDSKAAALGDAGVASNPDANSIYWNTAKLAFAPNKYGASFSYAPWLRDLVQDMGLMNLSGYYKISDKQALTVGLTYFDQGLIQFTNAFGEDLDKFHSREMSFTAGIAQKLSSDFSMGLNLKYINSNLVGSNVVNGTAGKPGQTMAFDLGIYYNKNRPSDSDHKTDFSYGLWLQNLGGKVNYGFGEYFIPANLKVGTQISHKPDEHNTFRFLVDLNKLLVPTPQGDRSELDLEVLPSIIGSFNDAPGGMAEELREVMASIGAEYNYDEMVALRAGYFYESRSKGDRKYFTTGIGVKLKDTYNIDLAYLIPAKTGNPLANTWRITLNFAMPNSLLKSRQNANLEDEE